MNNIFLIFPAVFFTLLIVTESRLAENLCKCKGYHSKLNPRIINGTKVGKDDFRFLVSLFIKNNEGEENENYQHICMGLVLNSEWILSTAQCSLPAKLNFTIYVGGLDHDLKSIYSLKDNYKTVSRIERHPNFTFASSLIDGQNLGFPKNDIALFKLSSPFKLGDETNLFAACLSKDQMIITSNPTSSVCEGDRGAALGINDDNKFHVVGILNFFWSIKKANVIERCILNSSAFFTPVFGILYWIDSILNLKNTCIS